MLRRFADAVRPRKCPRPKPYTARGLARSKCCQCQRPAKHQWSLRPCAIGRLGWYALCEECDLVLNAMVVKFLNVEDGEQLIRDYAARQTRVD